MLFRGYPRVEKKIIFNDFCLGRIFFNSQIFTAEKFIQNKISFRSFKKEKKWNRECYRISYVHVY